MILNSRWRILSTLIWWYLDIEQLILLMQLAIVFIFLCFFFSCTILNYLNDSLIFSSIQIWSLSLLGDSWLSTGYPSSRGEWISWPSARSGSPNKCYCCCSWSWTGPRKHFLFTLQGITSVSTFSTKFSCIHFI